MVTYWLEGKKMSVGSTNLDSKTSKHITMETQKEQEPYSSIPGFLNEDLLVDPS